MGFFSRISMVRWWIAPDPETAINRAGRKRCDQFGLGMNFSCVVFARFNRTPTAGRIMRLDKAKAAVYAHNRKLRQATILSLNINIRRF
ncbi:MAG: hypothetical protein JWR69_3151 [Pedosphaera sp.]|nr:hypothetical protein [Pedosphaera sp.]